MGEYNDLQLIELAKNDNECFEYLLNKYLKKYNNVIFKYSRVYKEDMDDLKQVLSLAVYEAIHKFDKNKINNVEYKPKHFIARVIKARLNDYIRSQFTDKRKIMKESLRLDFWATSQNGDGDKFNSLDIIRDNFNIEESVIQKEDDLKFKYKIFNNLSKLERECLELYLKGYRQSEIAKLKNIKTKTVDNALARAKTRVKRRYISKKHKRCYINEWEEKMKNTLGDLNTHLFLQLERLSDGDIKGEDLKEEIIRAKAVSVIAKQIIDNGTLVLEAQKMMNNRMDADMKLPKMLEG